MGKFSGLSRMGFKTGIVYRAHFFVSLIKIPLTLVVFFYLWRSIFMFSGEEIIQGYTFAEMFIYYVLSMLVGTLIYCDVDAWMNEGIKDGDVVGDFLRPVTYMKQLFCQYFGLRELTFLIEVFPIMVVSLFFLNVPLPSLLFGMLFILAVFLAILLNYFFTFCVGLTAFWLKEIQGIRRVKTAVMAFLEGALIPLTFFPLIFQSVFKYLPFQYLRFVPINIFLEKYALSEVVVLLSIQTVWILIFFFIAKTVFKLAFRKFAGAGI